MQRVLAAALSRRPAAASMAGRWRSPSTFAARPTMCAAGAGAATAGTRPALALAAAAAAARPTAAVTAAAAVSAARALSTASFGSRSAGASQPPRVTAAAPSITGAPKGASGAGGSAVNANTGKRNSDRVGEGIAVPIIDLSPYLAGTPAGKQRVAAQIREACERIGFMTIVGHGIPQAVVQGAWDATTAFFDLPVNQKQLVPMTADYPYGYIGFANENLSRGYDGKRSAPDLKECFCIGPYNPTAGMPGVRWVPGQPDINNRWLDYYKCMEQLSASLLRLFALALKLPENWFDSKITAHRSAFRMLNYPSQQTAPLPGQIRAGEHTDYGTLTILKSDERVAGLQVLARDGLWYGVAPVKDSFVVNIGDLMQRWTNDTWVSTLHRVVNPAGQTVTNERRQSMAFFHNLNGDAVVECIPTCVAPGQQPKYPPIEAWQHLIEKHEASTKGVKM